jgi:hypothetical protein
MTAHQQIDCLMTLAMAEAECGNFSEALRVAQEALSLKGVDAAKREEYEMCMQFFRGGKAFRNPALPSTQQK